MSKIDFSKAPKGATHHVSCPGANWYKVQPDLAEYWDHVRSEWVVSDIYDFERAHGYYAVTPIPIFEPLVSVEDAHPATAKQSAPSGKGSPILGMVLADLTNRALEGKEKYGEPLKANNGRNALWDAYQEALDLAMYLRQAIAEQESK